MGTAKLRVEARGFASDGSAGRGAGALGAGRREATGERNWGLAMRELDDYLARAGLPEHVARELRSLWQRADAATRESEERMRSIFRAAPTGIGVVIHRVFTEVNDRFCAMVGYAPEELIGQSARMIYPSDEHYAEVGREKYRQIAEHGIGTVETLLLRKDGVTIDVLMSSSPIDPEDLERGVTFTALDITERRRASEDRRRLEALLQRAERLESLGTLAGGIAHDFNNILGALLGYTEIALDELGSAEHLRPHLEQVQAAGFRARDLVQQILTFSREAEQEVRPTSLQPIVAEVVRFLRASVPAMVEIRERVDCEPGTVEADPTQLHQVLMNLGTNACQAIGGAGGVVEIGLEAVTVDEDLATRLGGVGPGPYAVVSVSDTGCGIAPEAMARIFDPFYTTKPRGEGTGLGLATAHGIVRGHGGAISSYSEVGVGTTFRVYLPVSARRPEAEEVAAAGAAPPGRGESLLIVDDEVAVARVTARMLSALGYRVETTSDPVAALAQIQAASPRYDLILADYAMPGMVGTELARQVHESDPGLPVVLISGFSHVFTGHSLEAVGIAGVVAKPFSSHQLAAAVRASLDARPEMGAPR